MIAYIFLCLMTLTPQECNAQSALGFMPTASCQTAQLTASRNAWLLSALRDGDTFWICRTYKSEEAFWNEADSPGGRPR